MLSKSIEFKNVVGQKIKVIDIPVLELTNRHYFMIQTRLQTYISSLYNATQEKSCYSFREYLKQKMKWPEYKDLYDVREFKSNA